MDTLRLPIILGSGRTILVETSSPTGEELVANTPFTFETLRPTLIDLGKELSAIIDAVSPKTASVEFGVELAVEAGRLTALLVNATSKANLKIVLTWGDRG